MTASGPHAQLVERLRIVADVIGGKAEWEPIPAGDLSDTLREAAAALEERAAAAEARAVIADHYRQALEQIAASHYSGYGSINSTTLGRVRGIARAALAGVSDNEPESAEQSSAREEGRDVSGI